MAKKKQVIDLENQRYGLFMSENSYDLDIAYGRNFLETDNVGEVKIHKINIIETKSNSLYSQTKSKDKSYFPPVKISAMVTVEGNAQSIYGDVGVTRNDSGNITFGVYNKELEEKRIEILRGDIVEYNMSGEKNRYYEVENAEEVNDTTDKTIGGFKPYWRKITAVPVKEDITPFLQETKGDI